MLKSGLPNISLGAFVVLASLFSSAFFAQPKNENPDFSSDLTSNNYYQLGDETYVYENPGTFDFIKFFPGNVIKYSKDTFRQENLFNIGAMVSVTALLVAYDQQMLDETQRFGRRIGLTGNNRMNRAFYVFGLPIELPHDKDTALYFIGDGWTHTSIAGLFLGYGLINKNSRALQTASQIACGMITTGLTTQLLKHITGRESPFKATAPGGKWRPFPDQIKYHKNVPAYDAFPSGHLATAMMTFTVINENYPHSKIVKPVGYTLLTILSFEMVNNGVHWVSDYPLALAMGYSLGKIAVARGRKSVDSAASNQKHSTRHTTIFPYLQRDGIGLAVAF